MPLKQLVRYAEAMGLERVKIASRSGQFDTTAGGLFIYQKGENCARSWNPLTDANDALELAEKMDVRVYKSGGNYGAYIYPYSEEVLADTLPAAICEAVDAALDINEKKEKR